MSIPNLLKAISCLFSFSQCSFRLLVASGFFFYIITQGFCDATKSAVEEPIASATTAQLEDKELEALDEELRDVDIFEDANELNPADMDPIEPVNRVVFQINRVVDGLVLEPVAILFENGVPKPIQKGIRNTIDNIFIPVSMVNSLLQGDVENFATSFFRFLINTTIGVFGTFDIAQEMGLKKKLTSLDDTLAKWGCDTGMYVVLPILGPSSMRDSISKAAEFYINPAYHAAKNKHRSHNHHQQNVNALKAIYAADGIMIRVENDVALRELEKSSIDFYSAMRSVYFQRKLAKQKELREKQ